MGDIFTAIGQPAHGDLLVGFDTSDDSAIYRLDEARALVQSVDFFTPIVDDAHTFGAIAAANALSDIYAMGGNPLTALSLVCFPHKTLDHRILARIVAGGAQKIHESGALVVGGHSVADDEIKFGYAVTGMVHPEAFWRNNTPQVGDRLLLSKPLGTGLITTAIKQDKLSPECLVEPIAEMARLNKVAAELAKCGRVHAVTDITGFGLMGHLFEMLRGKGYGARLEVEAIALFNGVWEAIDKQAITGADRTNRAYVADYELVENPFLKRFGHVLFDPQTSGGLLFSLPASEANALKSALEEAGHRPSLLGEVTADGRIVCT